MIDSLDQNKLFALWSTCINMQDTKNVWSIGKGIEIGAQYVT